MGNMDGAPDFQPDVSIDPRARIPPGGEIFRGEANRQDVFFFSVIEAGIQINGETDIPVRAFADFFAVQPDPCIGHRAVEHYYNPLIPRGFGDREVLSVPADTVDRKPARACVVVHREGTFDCPIMGQGDLPPSGVVEIDFFYPGDIPFMETPVVIERRSFRCIGHETAHQHDQHQSAPIRAVIGWSIRHQRTYSHLVLLVSRQKLSDIIRIKSRDTFVSYKPFLQKYSTPEWFKDTKFGIYKFSICLSGLRIVKKRVPGQSFFLYSPDLRRL